MSYALINKATNETVQFVVKEDEQFEVHDDFRWVDIPDDWVMEEGTNPPDFFWNPDTQKVQRKEAPVEGWEIKRQRAYSDLSVEKQLGNLYDDIEAGVFGDIQGKSKFFTEVKSLKESIPKV